MSTKMSPNCGLGGIPRLQKWTSYSLSNSIVTQRSCIEAGRAGEEGKRGGNVNLSLVVASISSEGTSWISKSGC